METCVEVALNWELVENGKYQRLQDYLQTSNSTFTWDPKWTQTGLRSKTALKYSVYMAIYMEISLQQLINSFMTEAVII